MDGELLEKLQRLSMLRLHPREAAEVAEELPALVAFADELSRLNQAMMELSPAEKPAACAPALRQDEPRKGLEQAAVLANAAAHSDDCILVPKTVG